MKKKRNIILIILGVIVLCVVGFLLWFFNRKFEVTLDYDGNDIEVLTVKYNKKINTDKIKDDLGSEFIGWFLVINEDELAKEKFDFNTKIKKDIKLKAVYNAVVEEEKEVITIKFDSKGGSKVKSITIEKDSKLKLPSNPTYKGYTFVNWVDKNNKVVKNNTVFSADATLYAKWKKVETKKEETPKQEEPKQETPKQETPKQETPKQEETKPEVKKEETISLSLSNSYMHRNGTKTSKATAKVENASGNVTYSLSSSVCAKINSSTGEITAIPYSELDSMGEQICEVGQTVTVTATLPSGKKASKKLILEGDLILSAGNNTYISRTTDINMRTNDFTVKANQSVKWNTSGTVSGSVTTNETTCIGKVNESSNSFATIIATTTGGQKVEVHWYSAVN